MSFLSRFILLYSILATPLSYAQHAGGKLREVDEGKPKVIVRTLCKCDEFKCTASLNSLKELGIVASASRSDIEVSGSWTISGGGTVGGKVWGVGAQASASVTATNGKSSGSTLYNSIHDHNFSDPKLLALVQIPKEACGNKYLDPTKVILPKGFFVEGESSGTLSAQISVGKVTSTAASASGVFVSASGGYDDATMKNIGRTRASTKQEWKVTSHEGQTLADFIKAVNVRLRGASEHIELHFASCINDELSAAKPKFEILTSGRRADLGGMACITGRPETKKELFAQPPPADRINELFKRVRIQD